MIRSRNRLIPPLNRTAFPKLFILFGLLFWLAAGSVSAQTGDRKITGKVTDSQGQGIPGVSIVAKGSTKGTVTGADGTFQLTTSAGTLVFSSVGFTTQEVQLGAQTDLKVSLSEENKALNEVVVVGYGTQKKVNMTGSVATIGAASIENRPVTNVSSSLAGLAPGVFVRQGSGKPGSDGATIRIRGTGTLNNSDALVIIDGIMGSMDAVNPNDIESISILKDAASASIYGSLAANGVILITTKKGSANRVSVSYTGLFSSSTPMNRPTFVSDNVRHMQLFNEGARNIGQSDVYSAATIALWQEANKNPNGLTSLGVPNYVAYPNTDWGQVVLTNNAVQNHNISVNGGNDKALYNLSIGYLDNQGLMKNTGSKRYQLRANVESKVAKFLTLGTQTFASIQTVGMANTDNLFNYLRQTTPGIYPYYNGKYGFAPAPEEPVTNNNLLTYLDGTGGHNRTSRLNTTLYATVNLIKGLTLETKVNYQLRQQEQNSYSNPIERWDFATNILRSQATTPDQLSTSYSYNKDYLLTFDNVLRYNTTIGGDHDFGALAGYNQYYFNYYDFSAAKKGLIDYNSTTLGSASEMQSIGGQEYDRAMRSFFGRVNYAYKSKYMVEANLRYDGSSRFSPQSRWGIFPSFSAGWRLSEEAFLQSLHRHVQNLKLRASWGKLGNNASGDYDYQATYGKVNYSFNNLAASGLVQSKFANPLLQWESTTVTDIGLEGNAFRGKMNFEIDYYNKLTDGILTTPPIFLTAGTKTAPTQNTAAVLNRGVELLLGWKDRVGDVNFSVTGNFSYNLNKVTNYKGQLQEGWTTDASGNRVYSSNLGTVSSGGDNRILEGKKINEYYLLNVYRGDGSHNRADGTVNVNGGPKDGMIRTQEDMAWLQAMVAAGYSFQPVGKVGKAQIYYGDIIYADTNGDGIYGNTFDRTFTGTSSAPKYNFGLNLSASWKGFDLSMLWAGSSGFQYYWNAEGYNNSIVRLGNGIATRIANDHYYYNDANPSDPANNINGKFPRLKYNGDSQNTASSNNWLYDASYVKLKNVQLGYSLPQSLLGKISVSRARVFVSGENLLMITAFPGLDPEIGGGVGYPTMKQYALGLNVTF
ncbi:MAG: TonB-dependent receptor [Siphonobacter aquaeclarae]|nr:TonB-dependent receptor [Siphonobacter aquaeclarae]